MVELEIFALLQLNCFLGNKFIIALMKYVNFSQISIYANLEVSKLEREIIL